MTYLPRAYLEPFWPKPHYMSANTGWDEIRDSIVNMDAFGRALRDYWLNAPLNPYEGLTEEHVKELRHRNWLHRIRKDWYPLNLSTTIRRSFRLKRFRRKRERA